MVTPLRIPWALGVSLCLIATAQLGQAAQVQDVAGMREVGAAPSRAELDGLLAQLRSPESSVRAEAILRLSELEALPDQAREVVPLVAAMLRTWPTTPKPYPAGTLTPQNLALRYLQQIGPLAKPALPEILVALRFDDPVIRWWAMSALESLRLGPEEADPALQGVIGWLESELTPKAVRARAQDAAEEKRLGMELYAGKEAEKAFVTWLPPAAWPDGIGVGFSTDLIFDAFRFLQSLGPGAKPALPVLQRLQQAQPESFEFWTSQTFATMGVEASETIPGLLQRLERSEPADDRALWTLMQINLDDPRVRPPVLRAFERYVASLATQTPPRIFTTVNLAVARIGPADAETIRAFARVIAAAPDAAFPGVLAYSGPAGRTMAFPQMVDSFVGQLKPSHQENVPDFLALARSNRPQIQAVGLLGLEKLGGLPDEFMPLLLEWLRTDPGDAFNPVQSLAMEILESMGQRAAPAVPVLVELFKGDNLWRKVRVAAALARIGLPAARPAVPEFEKLVAEALATPGFSSLLLLDQLLMLDPDSVPARAELARMAVTGGESRNGLEVRAVLLKHHLDVESQRTALLAGMAGADFRQAVDAAGILAREPTTADIRARALDRLFEIADSGGRADLAARSEAAASLEVLLPGDSRSEARLATLIRALLAERKAWSDLERVSLGRERDIARLVLTLARFASQSPETRTLLVELRGDASLMVRTAANGRSLIEF